MASREEKSKYKQPDPNFTDTGKPRLRWEDIEVTTDEHNRKWTFVIATGKPICGAKAHSTGLPCARKPLKNRNRCKLHGGKTLVGLDHPRWRHGMKSSSVPQRLLERIEVAEKDDKLLELRHEIALVDARVGDLLGRVDSGESGATWRAAKTAWVNHKDALRSGDGREIARTAAELDKIISHGYNDFATWDELMRTITQRRKLTESERKRLVETKQMMTAEEATILLGQVVRIIRERTFEIVPKDSQRTFLSALSDDIAYLVQDKQGAMQRQLEDRRTYHHDETVIES